jgi:hypothetical protein
MARDHGSIALYARYARLKGYLYLLCTVPNVRTFPMPKKEITQS